MTLDRDPMADRLVEAWLDEGPRTFAPGRLDRALADIHATPQRRQRPLPWSIPRMNPRFLTAFAGAAVLAVLFAAGALLPWLPATILGPATTPTPSATVRPTHEPRPSRPPSSPVAPAPTMALTPTFLAGDVPLVGTDWLLVGRIDEFRAEADPAYVSPIDDRPATLRFADDGVFAGDTGCRTIGGGWYGAPTGGRPSRADLVVSPGRAFACLEPLRFQDVGVIDGLDGARGMQLTTEPYTTLASNLTDADLDPALLDHFQSHPDLVRLIVRDNSGEGRLIYAPVTPGSVVQVPLPSAVPSAIPAPSFIAGDVPLVGTAWRLVGRIDGERAEGEPAYISPVGDRPATIRFKSDERWAGDSGCRVLQGTWDATPTGSSTFPADLKGGAWHEIPCTTLASAQDKSVIFDLSFAAGMQVTAGGYDLLASGLTDADLDPELLAHYQSHPDLVRLIIRDESGEGSLVYAPVAPDLGSLLGRWWEIAGYRSDDGTLVPAADPATLIRLDPDGTFSVTDGCATLDGTWGVRPVPDATPAPGDVDVDVMRRGDDCDAALGDTLNFLLGEADLGLGVTQTQDPAAWLYPDDASPELLARFAAAPDADWIWVRDAEQMEVVVLTPAGDAPEPDATPSAAPVAEVAYAVGDVPLTGTTWMIVGYQASVDPDAGPTYAAVQPDTTPYLRISDAGTVIGRFGPCEAFTAVTLRDPTEGSGPLFFETDAAYARGCTAASVRQAARLEGLFAQTAAVQRVAPGMPELAPGIADDRVAQSLRDHVGAAPDVSHLILRDGTGDANALLILAPVAGNLDPAVQPYPDPAPGRQPTPVLSGDRALTDDAWLLVGWRDADGRMRMDPWDWATQLVFSSGEGATSGGFSGTIPCGVIDGEWTGAILDGERGSGPFSFAVLSADSAPDCNAAMLPLIDSIRAGLEGATSVALGPQEIQLDIAGVPKAEMDPWLWAWLAANPNARLLVVRDAAGATSLVFAPVGATGDVAGTSPEPEQPTFQGVPLLTDDNVSAADTTWMVAAYASSTGGTLQEVDPEHQAGLRFSAAGLLVASNGCDSLAGGWTATPRSDATIPDGAQPFRLSPALDVDSSACASASTKDSMNVERLLERTVSLQVVDDLSAVVSPDTATGQLVDATRDLAGVRALVARNAVGAVKLVYLPAAEPLDTPLPLPTGAGPVPPPTEPVAGVVEFAAVNWLLVGWRSPDGTMRLADFAVPLELRVSPGGALELATPCSYAAGTWEGDAPDANGRWAFRIDVPELQPVQGCEPVDGPDALAARDALAAATSATVGQIEVQQDVAGWPKAEIDPWLWAWAQAHSDVQHLVIPGPDGRTELIFAPIPR